MQSKYILNFKQSLMKITDDLFFIKAHYLAARTDETRQRIIDGINLGIIKTKDDIRNITMKMSPTYQKFFNGRQV